MKAMASIETRSRVAPVAMDGEQFRALGHELVERIATFLDTIGERPVTTAETVGLIRGLIGAEAGLPEQGADTRALLAKTTEILFDHSLHNGHPRFYGYVTSSAAPIGMLGDLLAAAVNASRSQPPPADRPTSQSAPRST